MPQFAKRAVGGLLALIGVVLTVIGLWYTFHLGGSGTATFSTTASGTQPVVVPQTVLNRVEGVVKVTAVPREGGTAWVAAAAPSDAQAVLGDTGHTSVTGVSTQPWQLTTTTQGTGTTPQLATSDVWRNTTTGAGAVSMTIEQANAPETVIVQATKGQIERVELTWERKSWFVQSVIAALVGLFLLLSGLSLLWSSRHGSARPTSPDGTDVTDDSQPGTDSRAALTPPAVPKGPLHAPTTKEETA